MSILCFEKPEKIRSTEDHNNMFASEAPAAGTYVPNMSDEDRVKWKAKHIKKGDDPRIEIRRTCMGRARGSEDQGPFGQLLLVVRNDDSLRISIAGKAEVSIKDLTQALNEALEILNTIPRQPCPR